MKPPAFQFYADDFVSGVCDLTAREVGIYIMFLCYQWSKGYLPADESRLFIIARTNNEPHNEPENEAAVRHVIAEKFILCNDGRYRNERLEQVRGENATWRDKSIEGGKMSAAKRVGDSEWGKRMAAQRTTQRTNNEPPNEPINEPTTNSPSPSPSPIDANIQRGHPDLATVLAFGQMRGVAKEACEQFWHHFESTGWIDKNGHPIIKWQSKLMTWKPASASKSVPGASESIIRQKELDEVNKKISALKARDEHMPYSVKEKQQLQDLRTRQSELKQQLGWKV